jgi:predicted DNA-binding transcriptional regulator AlpA
MQNVILSSVSIPDLVDLIACEIETRLLNREQTTTPQPEADRWMNLPELCEYLPDRPQKATVYSWVSNSLIPCHKGSKKLRFLKSEIDLWLKSGRKKTFAELQAETSKRVKQ